MADAIVKIQSAPGIKRDGTKFEGDNYVDGQWVRFQRGLPRKMGGYRRVSTGMGGIVRQIHTQALDNFVYTHVGHQAGVQRFTLDYFGNASASAYRGPTGFTPNANFNWMFDAMFDGAGGGAVLIAHAAETLADISSGTNYPAYIGSLYDTTSLTEIPTPGVCGGIVVLHPYLFMYCKNGYIKWSDANDPTNFTTGDAGDAFISSSKIVKGLPLRGGGQSPAGIFWTLDSVIRATYTGGDDIFRFDTITSSSSILAVNGVIEHDGIFYWAGLDRFMLYNGVVRDIENNLNINYFFDGLNFEYANKVFAFKVPRFGEIWWCYPRGDATECTHAVIYNYRENTWYDTALPNGGRSAGLYAQVFRSPLMTGVEPIPAPPGAVRVTEQYPAGGEGPSLRTNFMDETYSSYDIDHNGVRILEENTDVRVTDTGGETYRLWRHEVGSDEIEGQFVGAVQSYFETADISRLTGDPPTSFGIGLKCIEPDFVQSGDMSVQVAGRINARAPEVYSEPRFFPAVAQNTSEQLVYFKEQRRELRLRFESNTVGGNYQMGQIFAHVNQGDGRTRS